MTFSFTKFGKILKSESDQNGNKKYNSSDYSLTDASAASVENLIKMTLEIELDYKIVRDFFRIKMDVLFLLFERQA